MQYFCSAFQNNLEMLFQQLLNPHNHSCRAVCAHPKAGTLVSHREIGCGRQVSMGTCLVLPGGVQKKTTFFSQSVWMILTQHFSNSSINKLPGFVAGGCWQNNTLISDWVTLLLTLSSLYLKTSFFPPGQIPATPLHNVWESVCVHTQVPKSPYWRRNFQFLTSNIHLVVIEEGFQSCSTLMISSCSAIYAFLSFTGFFSTLHLVWVFFFLLVGEVMGGKIRFYHHEIYSFYTWEAPGLIL